MSKHESPAVNDAYARYVAETLLRLDLEVTTETIRQYMEHISLCDKMGDHAKSRALKRTVEQERAHALDLASALGAGAPCPIGPTTRTIAFEKMFSEA